MALVFQPQKSASLPYCSCRKHGVKRDQDRVSRSDMLFLKFVTKIRYLGAVVMASVYDQGTAAQIESSLSCRPSLELDTSRIEVRHVTA
jgi:hypothetical protein